MDLVEREITIPAAPADVWRAVSDSSELSAWFGADVRLEPRQGGHGMFRWADGTERAAVVEEVEAERRLAFRWLPFQRAPHGDLVRLPSTRVDITLDAVPEGTRVRVVEQTIFSGRTIMRARAAVALIDA